MARNAIGVDFLLSGQDPTYFQTFQVSGGVLSVNLAERMKIFKAALWIRFFRFCLAPNRRRHACVRHNRRLIGD